MIYRYCHMIFIIPGQQQWSIFPILNNGTPGQVLSQSQTPIKPRNYLVSDENRNGITIQLTTENAPHCVTTVDHSACASGQGKINHLQSHFRTSLCERDTVCAISNLPPALRGKGRLYKGLDAAHIFPTSQLGLWNVENYKRFITDSSPASIIGKSGLYSPQNGLLLDMSVHEGFAAFLIGVDPDADDTMIIFGDDGRAIGVQVSKILLDMAQIQITELVRTCYAGI